MRTLKKTLCLVLVLAMVMSCGIFASADFTDAAEIQHTEEVEVLVALGVIEGMPDGSFAPTTVLNRAQACTILVRLMDAEDIKGTAPYTDLAGYEWAESAIAYCAATGIVNGVGDGKFNPGGELTGSAWLKMLLGALGYDAQVEGMTGSSWEIGVATLAKKTGLQGKSTIDQTKAITRDDACYFAYNALFTEVVEYEESGSSITIGDLSISASKKLVSTETTLGETYFGLSVDGTVDAFGRPGYAYTNGYWYADTSKYYGAYVAYADEPVLTYTSAVKFADVAKALGCSKTTDSVELTVITDGVAAEAADYTKLSTGTLGGNGVAVEVYKTGNGTYDVVVINTYVTVLTEDNIYEGKAATATTDAVAAGLLIGDYDKYVTDVEAFEEDDVVLYTVAAGEIQSVVVAESVSGTVTATGKGYFRLDGDKMTLAANTYGDPAIGTAPLKAASSVVCYVDSYGYVVYATEPSAVEAEIDVDYLYVLYGQAKVDGGKAGDLFSDGTASSAAAKVVVVDLTTGEMSVVDLGVAYDKDSKSWKYVKQNGKLGTAVTADDEWTEGFYSYVVLEDGSYALASVTTNNVTLKKNTAKVGVSVPASSKTVLTIVEHDADWEEVTVSTVTGIKNFPTLSEKALVVANKNYIESITIVMEAQAEETTANYAVFAGVGETDKDGTKVAFYVDGEYVEYYTELTGLVEGTVYDITVVDGVVTVADGLTGTEAGKITYIDDTYVVAGGELYTLVDGYVVVDAGADYAVSELAVGDVITVYSGTDGVEFVVIAE